MLNYERTDFETVTDAKTFFENSGVFDYEIFADETKAADFVNYLWRRGNAETHFDVVFSDWLVTVGEKPSDYNI